MIREFFFLSCYYIVLYCIVLYCIVLYCIVLYCIVLYCIVLYCIVLYCIVTFCLSASFWVMLLTTTATVCVWLKIISCIYHHPKRLFETISTYYDETKLPLDQNFSTSDTGLSVYVRKDIPWKA